MTGSMGDMENQRQALGEAVASTRKRRGWSKERAAAKAEISAITWKRIEDGLNVHDVKLAAALRVLGIDESGRSVDAAALPTQRDERIARLRADIDRIREELDRLEGQPVERDAGEKGA